MSRTCKLIRDQLHFGALSCLDPEDTEIGFRVMTLVTYRGMTIPMKYLEEHDHVSLYYKPDKEKYYLYKKHSLTWCNDCPPSVYNISIQCSPLTQLLLMHSAFSFMMRIFRAAVRAAWAAAGAARDAARAAWADAGAAADAARAAADAAWAAAAAGAARAARKAYKLMITYRKEVSNDE